MRQISRNEVTLRGELVEAAGAMAIRKEEAKDAKDSNEV
jgi:hypothetical protein